MLKKISLQIAPKVLHRKTIGINSDGYRFDIIQIQTHEKFLSVYKKNEFVSVIKNDRISTLISNGRKGVELIGILCDSNISDQFELVYKNGQVVVMPHLRASGRDDLIKIPDKKVSDVCGEHPHVIKADLGSQSGHFNMYLDRQDMTTYRVESHQHTVPKTESTMSDPWGPAQSDFKTIAITSTQADLGGVTCKGGYIQTPSGFHTGELNIWIKGCQNVRPEQATRLVDELTQLYYIHDMLPDMHFEGMDNRAVIMAHSFGEVRRVLMSADFWMKCLTTHALYVAPENWKTVPWNGMPNNVPAQKQFMEKYTDKNTLQTVAWPGYMSANKRDLHAEWGKWYPDFGRSICFESDSQRLRTEESQVHHKEQSFWVASSCGTILFSTYYSKQLAA